VIAECIAVYAEDLAFVQVSAIILDDDGTSLHQHLKNATVQLMYNDTRFLTKALTPADYNAGERAFYVFFLNPPVERNMYVLLNVETFEGKKTKVKSLVRLSTQLAYKDMGTNPMLGGKPVLDYTNSTGGNHGAYNGVKTPM
jgi:hypothetical protein